MHQCNENPLDANLRLVMREEIRKLQERLHITTAFVTRDQFEAIVVITYQLASTLPALIFKIHSVIFYKTREPDEPSRRAA